MLRKAAPVLRKSTKNRMKILKVKHRKCLLSFLSWSLISGLGVAVSFWSRLLGEAQFPTAMTGEGALKKPFWVFVLVTQIVCRISADLGIKCCRMITSRSLETYVYTLWHHYARDATPCTDPTMSFTLSICMERHHVRLTSKWQILHSHASLCAMPMWGAASPICWWCHTVHRLPHRFQSFQILSFHHIWAQS